VEPRHGSPLAVHVRGGVMRALEPARSGMRGLKTSCCCDHARGVAAPHHSQVAENVGEAAPSCKGRLRPGESPMRYFANEGHSRLLVVPEVFVHVFLDPAMGSATGLLG
jgi:hypothetical protein